MPENDNATQGAPAEPERTFTQAEVDAIVSDRLKRERAKYSDYEDIKAKAEAAQSGQDDLQKATARADDLQKQLDALTEANKARDLREKIAEETGVKVPEGLRDLDKKEIRHKGVINIDEIQETVLELFD